MNVTFVRSEDVTPHIKTFWFRPEKPVRHIAGQFTELYLPHEAADDRGIRRWFTISSSPTEELIGVTTRFEPLRGSTYKNELAKLRPGDKLKLADPMGDFVLPKDPSIPLLFVAAGLGITPVRSIIKWLSDKDEKRKITLLYSVSAPEELAFHNLFIEYDMRFIPHFSSQNGRLTHQDVLGLVKESNAQIYLSGPEPLVETLYRDLQKGGIPTERLLADYFNGYTT